MKRKKKKSGFLLFKNALKQAFRNKIQLIGLTILILLSSIIFSIMQTSLARITNEYNILISENQSNIHDFIFDFDQSIKKQDAPEPIDEEQLAIEAVLEDQQLYLNEIANQDNKFIWERVEARTMQLSNNKDAKILKLVTYNKYARIDKLIISEGYNIGQNPNIKVSEEKQVVINKEFALKNNLKIGDVIRVQEDRLGNSLKVNEDINNPKNGSFNWLQIVGFGTSADFITPIIDQSTPLPNKWKEGILYISPTQFGLQQKNNINNNTLWYYYKSKESITISSNSDVEIYYVGKWTTNKKDITVISDFLKEKYINSINLDAKLVYLRGDSNYKFNNRTAILPSTIYSFTTLLIGLLLIVLLITGIIIVLITYKNINNSKPQLGILKALGYSNWKILITSLAYPMLASFIGTILVFLPASGLQILIVNTFANYFNLNFGKFVFDTIGYFYCLLLTFGFLSIFAWIISALVISKNPINLINNISLTRDSNFTKFVKKVSFHRPFLTRFRLALFTSSIGKMAAASLTMFLGTVLMTVSIIGPKIMSDNKIVNYTGMNYKSLTEYVNPTYNSVFTFYKTYNPTYDLNNEPWKYTKSSTDKNSYYYPDRSPEEYASNLLNNDISPEAYAPIAPDPAEASALLDLSMNGLTYLYGKMLTKEFLQALDDSQTEPMFISIIVALVWQQAKFFYDIINNSTTKQDLYSNINYKKIRTFYLQYRSTITMNLNPNIIDEQDSVVINKEKFIKEVNKNSSWQADSENFEKELNNFKFDTKEKPYLHIENEEDLLNNTEPTNEQDKEQLIRKVLIWFYAIFYNRIGQTITQGTYTQSPYFIKQNIARAFENPDAKFNVSFNVIPFDKKTDELGTYFIGNPDKLKFNNKQYSIKVYGLQNEHQLGHNSLMQLYDINNNALNYTLERKNNNNAINIVINQTIAKQLKLSENDIFYMSTNGTIMKTKINYEKNENEFENIDLNKINFDRISNETPEKENNASLKTQLISYNQIKSTKDGAYPNLGTNATAMLKEVANGNVVIDHDKTFHKFKISGVYNGYGQPTAFISKANADELLNFNESKKAFFEIFKKEWQNKGLVNGIHFEKLEELTYEDFQKIKEDEKIKIIFNNEFPIFNFKFSSANNLPDVDQSFSVSQSYGDYSSFGMNGGTENQASYQGYGQGSISTLLPLYNHKQLLNQITQLINTVLLFFIIFSLIISFFIILLTSNLVIYENKKIIVTMKTLGYSDSKITNIVIGMYLPMIALMFIIGFPIGLLIIKYILNYLAFNTTWVLPFFFTWWIPVLIGLIVFGIYIITYIIEWQTMKKIKVLTVLNETN